MKSQKNTELAQGKPPQPDPTSPATAAQQGLLRALRPCIARVQLTGADVYQPLQRCVVHVWQGQEKLGAAHDDVPQTVRFLEKKCDKSDVKG